MDCLREAESARRSLYVWKYFLFLIVILSILSFIENIIDGLLTRSWIRPKAFVFLAYDQFIVMTANDQFIVMINLLLLSLWLVFLSVAILVTLFLELLMKVIYAVKRLKLLHLIVCVFINTSLACSYVALLVFSMFTLNCDFNLCCVFFFTLRIVAFVFYYSFIGCV